MPSIRNMDSSNFESPPSTPTQNRVAISPVLRLQLQRLREAQLPHISCNVNRLRHQEANVQMVPRIRRLQCLRQYLKRLGSIHLQLAPYVVPAALRIVESTSGPASLSLWEFGTFHADSTVLFSHAAVAIGP